MASPLVDRYSVELHLHLTTVGYTCPCGFNVIFHSIEMITACGLNYNKARIDMIYEIILERTSN